MKFSRLLPLFSVLLLLMAAWFLQDTLAQISDEAHVEFTSIKPGQTGAIVEQATAPLAVNYNGNLIDAVGLWTYGAWLPGSEQALSIRVVDSIAPDTMLVRIRSFPVRSKYKPKYTLNYIDTLISGQTRFIPPARAANTGYTYGTLHVVPPSLSGSSEGDSTVIYFDRYGGVAQGESTHRAISYYGSVTSTVPDTGSTLSWKGGTRLTFSIRADDDSCTVRILTRIFAGGWGTADYVLRDSTVISSSLFSQFSMARDSIPPGDSLQVIVVPLTPFGTDPISFGAVARGDY